MQVAVLVGSRMACALNRLGGMRKTIAVGIAIVACGCLPPTKAPIETQGTYDVTGRWIVGAPLADGRTPGQLTAELLVEEAVELAPIPGTFEDEARDALDAVIGDFVRDAVDSNLPPELRPGGTLRDALEATLAEVDVESTLVLDGNLRGTETIHSVSLTRNGTRHELVPSLLSQTGALQGDWDGNQRDEDEFRVADHTLDIRYIALVRFAVDVMLGAGKFDSLVAQAEAAVPCEELATNPIQISVGGVSYTIETNILEQACTFARNEVLDRILGRFDLALLTSGGPVRVLDIDEDGIADGFVSEEGYGGALEIPYVPNAISPVLLMSFGGTRRPD